MSGSWLPAVMFSSTWARAGLKNVRIHDLRHTFTSTAVAAGQGPHMIGKLLGQAERYVSAWRINRRGYRRAKGGSRSHPPGPPDFGRTLTRTAFALAYTSNRRNATQAAIAAGYSPNGADSKSAQLLRDVRVQNLVGTLTAQAEETAELTLEIALRQNARIAMFDVGQLYREDGTAIPIGELDPRWLGILQFGAKYCPKTEKV